MQKKSRPGFPAVLLLFTLLGAATPTGIQAEDMNVKDKYVELVVGVLRAHVVALRQLVANEFKYSDNVVQHAVAIEGAFGMLGPMEWHVAEAYNLSQESGAPMKLSEKEFEQLAARSQNALQELSRAAGRYMQDGDSESVLNSITAMMKTCGDCHSQLPPGTVPKVWKGLKK